MILRAAAHALAGAVAPYGTELLHEIADKRKRESRDEADGER
jgi:hypothetical protein